MAGHQLGAWPCHQAPSLYHGSRSVGCASGSIWQVPPEPGSGAFRHLLPAGGLVVRYAEIGEVLRATIVGARTSGLASMRHVPQQLPGPTLRPDIARASTGTNPGENGGQNLRFSPDS